MSTSRARLVAIGLGAACLACAPAPRMGEAVDIAEESAIIIWDAATRTQHFIRRAEFRTEAKDFGFLVPTPSVPELKEAEDAAFGLLERITTPPEMEMAKRKAEAPKAAPAAVAAKVEVVATAKVAGYDAAVLRANDAGALDGWLKSHDYHSSDELKAWFKPYVDKGWLITAFKISAEGGGRARAQSVRMSFQAEQPFFPYREPAANAGAGAPRLLTVYFLGDVRPEGRVGESGAWPGRTDWSNTISVGNRNSLLRLLQLPESTAPAATRLTKFTDGASPRPGRDDLYFSKTADQGLVPDPEMIRKVEALILEHQRQSERQGWLLAGAALVAAIAAVFGYRKLRRKT